MQVEVIPSNERTLSYAEGLVIGESELADVLLHAFGDPECPGCEETYDELTAQIFDAIEEKGFEVAPWSAFDLLPDAVADKLSGLAKEVSSPTTKFQQKISRGQLTQDPDSFDNADLLETLGAVWKAVDSRDEVNLKLKRLLDEHEALIEEQENVIKKKDAVIASLTSELKSKERVIALKDEMIAFNDSTIAIKNAIIDVKNQIIAAKDNDLNKLRSVPPTKYLEEHWGIGGVATCEGKFPAVVTSGYAQTINSTDVNSVHNPYTDPYTIGKEPKTWELHP